MQLSGAAACTARKQKLCLPLAQRLLLLLPLLSLLDLDACVAQRAAVAAAAEVVYQHTRFL